MCFLFHKWGKYGEIKVVKTKMEVYDSDYYNNPMIQNEYRTIQERYCTVCGKYDKRIIDIEYKRVD